MARARVAILLGVLVCLQITSILTETTAGNTAKSTTTNTESTRKAKSTVSVVDSLLSISDSVDLSEARKYKVTFPQSLEDTISVDLTSSDHPHLLFEFKLKISQQATGKALQPQQVFLRIARSSNSNSIKEVVFPVKYTGKQYSISLDLVDDLNMEFNGQSGSYKVELIVGDAQTQNPFSWTVASLQLTFPSTVATLSPFDPLPEIQHAFRPPEKRATTAMATLFTMATLAPWAILIIGLPLVGANIRNFPTSGTYFLLALGFEACLGLSLLLIAYYWLGFVNMFEALERLAILLVPGVFCAKQTFNYLASRSFKKKAE